MGFFSKVSSFVGKGAQYLGKKVADGVRYGVKNSEKISGIAGKVSNIAEKVGDGAMLGAGITASMGLEPIAGALGAIGGVSKGVMKGADAVKGVADKVSQGKATAKRFGIDANALADRMI